MRRLPCAIADECENRCCVRGIVGEHVASPPPIFERVARKVVARRSIAWAVTLAVIVLAIAGVSRLRVDFSSASFYGDGSAATASLRAFHDRFGADDRTLVVIATTDEDRGVLAPERLRALDGLTQALALDPAVSQVTSLARLRPAAFAPTLAEVAEGMDPAAFDRFAEAILTDERVVPLLVSRDGRATAIIVDLRDSSDDLAAITRTLARLRTIIEAHASSADLALQAAGLPAIRAAFFELTIRDQLVLVPVTLALVGLGLAYAFRSAHAVLVVAVVAGLPTLVLLGAMGWLGEPIGLLNQAYFTLLPVIAVADAVHLVTRAQEEARTGVPWPEAVTRATARVGWACFLTSLTTAAGFGSLALAGMPILRRFGLYAALGVTLAWFAAILLGPLLLTYGRPPTGRAGGRITAALGRWSVARPRLALLLALGVSLGAGLLWPRVVVDNRLTGLLLPDHPVARANAVLDRALGGSLSLELELVADPDHWRSADGQRELADVHAWARTVPEIRVALVPHGSVPELVGFIVDGHARISLRTGDVGGQAFEALAMQTQDAVAARTRARTIVTGTAALAYGGVNRITHDLRGSLFSVFLVITIAIAVLFRSVALGLVSVPPNAIPLVVGYGAVALVGIPLDPLATVVLTVALGLAVDDTIHLVARFGEGRARGDAPERALAQAIEHTGRAVALTSVVLAVGLSIHLLSSFPPLRVLGGLGAFVIVLAWVCDLVVLPPLLRWTAFVRGDRGGTDPR